MKIQIYLDGRWQTAATLELLTPDGGRRGEVRVAYEAVYAADRLGAADLHAISCRHPVNLSPIISKTWPAFLIDLLPQGAARRRLIADEGREDMPEWELLQKGAWNPVGNLRVFRANATHPISPHPGFTVDEMLERGDGFIEHAMSVGASVAGATDAQGEMPKFWLVEDADGRIHPDGGHVDAIARAFYLVKFPPVEAGPYSEAILRNEEAYQRVAAAMGLRVTPRLPAFKNGGLLSPRFDREIVDGVVHRLGVESVYSLTGVIENGAMMRHHEVLFALHAYVTDFERELIEYVSRDVLNLAMGNRDNHGRNTAVLKHRDGRIELTPLYDFGPTFLDARGLPRATSWAGAQLQATDWNGALLDLATRFSERDIDLMPVIKRLMAHLRELGGRLQSLSQIMRECGVDEFIIERRTQDIENVSNALMKLGDVPRVSFGRRPP